MTLGITRRTALLGSAAAALGAVPQISGEARKAEINLNGRTISIDYTGVRTDGRTFGKTLAPFGKVWAFGSGAPPRITVNAYTLTELFELLPGAYSLYVIPRPDKWTLIPNTGKGAKGYDPSKDVGHLDLPVKPLRAPVQELTFTLAREASNVTRLSISFASASVSTVLKVL